MNKRDEKPSIYTLIYWLIQDKKINPETIFIFSELFWPEFIKINGFVFLKEKFSENAFNEYITRKSNPEYWINLLTLDDFFSELEDAETKSKALAKILMEMWQEKLKKDFPCMNFTVAYLADHESEDYGITFYQNSSN